MAMNEELVGFVKEGLRQRLPRPEIESALLRAGWPADQVQRALAGFADVDFPIPVPRPVPQVSARDAFMYVVMFVTLFISAYNFGSLIFELIDRTYPDPASNVYAVSTLQAVRWSVSSLIVAFPLFLFVAWLIGRAIRREPTKRASKVRRNLTYVTLFIASLVLIGDFISLVYNFLGGELTRRFVLKVVTVGLIAGTIFGYYLLDLRADERDPET
jgi:hypothetical protein